MSTLKLDLALGEGTLTALLPASKDQAAGALTVPTALQAGMDDPGPALRQGLGRLEEALRERLHTEEGEPLGRVRVRVALLPPLSEVRLLELPPLRPDELVRVLRRDAQRHFLGRRQPVVVAGEVVEGDGAPPRVLAAAASAHLVEALVGAVAARGWEAERIAPAQAAWLHAVEVGSEVGSEETLVRLAVAVVGDTAHLVRAEGHAPPSFRRLPTADVEAVVEAAGPDPGRLTLFAVPGQGTAVLEGLRDAGWVVAGAPPSAGTAAEAAARHLAAVTLELVPESLARTRKLRSRRITVRLAAAALVILAASAVVHAVGVAREARSAQTERAELRAVVAPALAARDSLDRMERRLEDLRSVDGASARWTLSLVELAMVLPPETHLVSLRAAGDTLVLEAEGPRAGDALAALQDAPTLNDVRLEGPIRRELERGATSRERFTLSALVARDETAPALALERFRNGPVDGAEGAAELQPGAEPGTVMGVPGVPGAPGTPDMGELRERIRQQFQGGQGLPRRIRPGTVPPPPPDTGAGNGAQAGAGNGTQAGAGNGTQTGASSGIQTGGITGDGAAHTAARAAAHRAAGGDP